MCHNIGHSKLQLYILTFATFSSNVIIAIKCIRTEERPFGFFMPVLFVIFLWRFYVFFLGPTGLKARPLLYCLWALQPPNLVLILQHTGFKMISEWVKQANVQPQRASLIGAEKMNRTLNNFWLEDYFQDAFVQILPKLLNLEYRIETEPFTCHNCFSWNTNATPSKSSLAHYSVITCFCPQLKVLLVLWTKVSFARYFPSLRFSFFDRAVGHEILNFVCYSCGLDYY